MTVGFANMSGQHHRSTKRTSRQPLVAGIAGATPFTAAIAGFVPGFGLGCHEELGLPSFLRASALGDAIEMVAAVIACAMFYLFVLGGMRSSSAPGSWTRSKAKRHHAMSQRMLATFLAAGVGDCCPCRCAPWLASWPDKTACTGARAAPCAGMARSPSIKKSVPLPNAPMSVPVRCLCPQRMRVTPRNITRLALSRQGDGSHMPRGARLRTIPSQAAGTSAFPSPATFALVPVVCRRQIFHKGIQ